MKLTARQQEAQEIIAGAATHILGVGGSRCVSWDTIIDGYNETIEQLAKKNKRLTVLTREGYKISSAPFYKGADILLQFELETGRTIKVTPDHLFHDGAKWIRADALSCGMSLVSRTFEQTPPRSNLVFYLLAKLLSVLRLLYIAPDFPAYCSKYFRQYDAPLHPALVSGQSFDASLCDEVAHSREDRRASLPGLNIRTLNRQAPEQEYTHSGLLSFRLFWERILSALKSWASYVVLQTCELFQAIRRQIQQCSALVLRKVTARALHRCGFRECVSASEGNLALSQRFSASAEQKPGSILADQQSHCQGSLDYTNPLQGSNHNGFSCSYLQLSKIVSIKKTETAESYYTVSVPSCKEYCANGILNHNSGKTFLFTRNLIVRALKAPESRHAIFRFRLSHLVSSVFLDTFPKVMKLCWPEMTYDSHIQEKYVTFPNGSEIWFAGLDDKDRTEKILGMEFATLYFNECSQIPYNSIAMARTRLSQKVEQRIENYEPEPLRLRAFYDENPPSKNHWTYRTFIEKSDPETRAQLSNPNDYAVFFINPVDNKENLSSEYLGQLESLPAKMRARFLEGRFADATPNALFPDEYVDRWRVIDGKVPDFVRVVVAVDPSGSDDIDNADNDEIGIMVVGLGTDGNAYVLEDVTVKAGPATWGRIATTAFDRHAADCIVGETNYGGAMVQHTIQVSRPRTPFKAVTASRGKYVRAEPFSALYEQGKVRHVGRFVQLEEELAGFSSAGYTGGKSPNRADALIWGLAELFPGMIRATKPVQSVAPLPVVNRW